MSQVQGAAGKIQGLAALMFRLWSFLLAAGVVGLDQLTKAWIRSNLQPGESLFHIGFFRIDFVHNTGAAFGMFQGHSQVFTVISILGAIAFILIIIFADRFPVLERRLSLVALGLLLAGTVGNLIDRFFIGYVTDFIDFTYWPAFNVADASITIGVILFIFSIMTYPSARKS